MTEAVARPEFRTRQTKCQQSRSKQLQTAGISASLCGRHCMDRIKQRSCRVPLAFAIDRLNAHSWQRITADAGL